MFLVVGVVFDSSTAACEGLCGTDWSVSENVETARERIRQKFGDEIKLELIDLVKTDNTTKDRYENTALPVLTVDGHSRICGPFDIRQILDAIEVELEINR